MLLLADRKVGGQLQSGAFLATSLRGRGVEGLRELDASGAHQQPIRKDIYHIKCRSALTRLGVWPTHSAVRCWSLGCSEAQPKTGTLFFLTFAVSLARVPHTIPYPPFRPHNTFVRLRTNG